ncbi:hypothetical protein SAMN05444678_110150 [Sphingomonas sp. YR710]|nr:hypothetical protein SAMN05444678_110150 [Sphingomonas sp. YR710]
MLAKTMERMAYSATPRNLEALRWRMSAATLQTLREISERVIDELDAPRLQDLDPPMFMGIPIEIGELRDGQVELVTL